MLEKIYYLAGIKDKETGEVKIYSGGTRSDPKFCILGNGLGKAYLTKKSAQNRIKDLNADLHRIRSESYFKKIDFIIYEVETKITESEVYTNGEIYFN